MKIVQINATCGVGSTGKICIAVSRLLTERGIENYILYSSGYSDYEFAIKCSSDSYIKLQALKSHIWGNYGFNSHFATRKIISELERIQPDIVHLHNIHGHDCSLTMLFQYFRTHPNIKLYWTFHDCWAFTGYCPHYLMTQCLQWKTQCTTCPQFHEFSFFYDRSSTLFAKKKALFLRQNLTIITPSEWLAGEVKKSFLRDYEVKVINNGIDLNVFKPTTSNFREKYNLQNKRIILGVAFDWGIRKGLDVFVELAHKLDEVYQIVLVGINEEDENRLPQNIITIRRTHSQKELAEIYSAADIFFNPTREDNYPTVNMESIACGTPVVTFSSGGSAETISYGGGVAIDNNIELTALKGLFKEFEENLDTYKRHCSDIAKCFDENRAYTEYIGLYGEATNE